MRKFLPSLGYMLAIAASVYFLLIIFLSDVLLTVSYAIAGETFAVVATLQIMLTFGILYWPICFPIMYATFHIYDRRLWYKLHRSWADGRMRLNPNDQP